MKDNKKIIIAFIVFSMLLSLLAIFAGAREAPTWRSSARASALYDPTRGIFLSEKQGDERLPMASTTKIMTALIAIERSDPDVVITIPREAVGIEGSSVYLTEGDTISVRDLIYSTMLASANDAATALAIHIGGDVHGFAEIMNERAYAMGLTNTHYDNPHGLDSEEHYTTARDLAILAGEALKNEEFKKISSTYKHSFFISDKPRTVVNHNKLLSRVEDAVGVKTGYTKRCGRCLVGAIERDGVLLVSVTLDDPNDWVDHEAMLEGGFSEYKRVDLAEITDTEFTLSSPFPGKGYISANIPESERYATLHPSDLDCLTVTVDLPEVICYAVKRGDKLGELRLERNEKIIKAVDIVAKEDSSPLDFFNKKT
ncbi:MAG: D-alanyl-D-alanine carboxypeptidase [Clostridia bacterium]|nr:D-alanyl-D-alanine carboxypeptidase [Clostridia bacterium]